MLEIPVLRTTEFMKDLIADGFHYGGSRLMNANPEVIMVPVLLYLGEDLAFIKRPDVPNCVWESLRVLSSLGVVAGYSEQNGKLSGFCPVYGYTVAFLSGSF